MFHKLIPNKYNYHRWTLPNKISFWSLILAIIAIIITLILEGNPFKKVHFVDSTEKSILLRDQAHTSYLINDFDKMLLRASEAYEIKPTVENLEYLALSHYKKNNFAEVVDILQDRLFDLTDNGKWIYFNCKFGSLDHSNKKQLESYLSFVKNLDLNELQPDTIVDSLRIYLILAGMLAHLNNDRGLFYSNAQVILNYVNIKESEFGFGCEVEMVSLPFTNKFNPYVAKKPVFDDYIINLNSIFYDFGVTIIATPNISTSELDLAFKYINKGFNSKLYCDTRDLVLLSEKLDKYHKTIMNAKSENLMKDYYYLLIEMERSLNNVINEQSIIMNNYGSQRKVDLTIPYRNTEIITTHKNILGLLKLLPNLEIDFENYQIKPESEVLYYVEMGSL